MLASAQYSADANLRCDLLEVKRVSGGALLVRWRLINTGSAPQSSGLVAGAAPKAIHYDFDWSQLYYTDPAENKKYAFLTDSENNRVLDMWWGDLGPGEQRLQWAKFPAPPATSAARSLYIFQSLLLSKTRRYLSKETALIREKAAHTSDQRVYPGRDFFPAGS